MTESSAEKTKRNLLHHMTQYEWKMQYCLFPSLSLDNFENDKVLAVSVIPSKINEFKDKLRTTFKEVAFLCVLRSLGISNKKIRGAYGKSIPQIYISIYSSQVLDQDKLNKLIARVHGEEIELASPLPVTEYGLARIYRTISNQRLHNLEKLLTGFPKLKRWTVVNEKQLIDK